MDHCDNSTSVVPVGDTSDKGAYVCCLLIHSYRGTMQIIIDINL